MKKIDFALRHVALGTLLLIVVVLVLFGLVWNGVAHLLGFAFLLAVATSKGLLLLWVVCVLLSALSHGLTNIIKRWKK